MAVDIDKMAKAAEDHCASDKGPCKIVSDLLTALKQSQKESIEHQLELLARDTDILLLKKRVAELEGVIEYIEEYVPNSVAAALSRKDGD